MSGLLILLFTLGSLIRSNSDAKIVFAGDAMQHAAQIDAAKKASGEFDYSSCFEAVSPVIEEADFAVVNLEAPLGGAPYRGYPCFSAPDAFAEALALAGFDMMLTANNHTLDRGSRGLVRTIDKLDEYSIAHLGTYRNRHERDSVLPMIQTVKGFRIGFLNYTYGTNGIEAKPPVVVDYIDKELIKDDIRHLREAGAELITVCIHWGDEYKLLPNVAQIALADFLADNGVDMIIGSHPHVIQPMEMRSGKDGRNCFLVYSLGNFISNMKTVDTRGGAIVTVTLSRDSMGKAFVKDATYRLVFTVPGSFNLVPVDDYTPESWAQQCNAFEKSAERIFRQYNRNVARDTSLIKNRRLPALESILPLK